jgi:hypothetical protein
MYMCCSLTINPAGLCDVCGHVYVLFLQNPMGPCHVMCVGMYMCCSSRIQWGHAMWCMYACMCAVLPWLIEPCQMMCVSYVYVLFSPHLTKPCHAICTCIYMLFSCIHPMQFHALCMYVYMLFSIIWLIHTVQCEHVHIYVFFHIWLSCATQCALYVYMLFLCIQLGHAEQYVHVYMCSFSKALQCSVYMDRCAVLPHQIQPCVRVAYVYVLFSHNQKSHSVWCVHVHICAVLPHLIKPFHARCVCMHMCCSAAFNWAVPCNAYCAYMCCSHCICLSQAMQCVHVYMCRFLAFNEAMVFDVCICAILMYSIDQCNVIWACIYVLFSCILLSHGMQCVCMYMFCSPTFNWAMPCGFCACIFIYIYIYVYS